MVCGVLDHRIALLRGAHMLEPMLKRICEIRGMLGQEQLAIGRQVFTGVIAPIFGRRKDLVYSDNLLVPSIWPSPSVVQYRLNIGSVHRAESDL